MKAETHAKFVTLTPLAITDLNVRYARRLEGDKIRHYCISAASVMLNPHRTPRDIILDYLYEKEGIVGDVEEARTPRSNGSYLVQVTDVTDSILKGKRKVRKDLEKLKLNSLLYQHPVYERALDKYKDIACHLYYKYVNPFLVRLFRKEIPPGFYVSEMIGVWYSERAVPRLDPVRFISYCYEEPNEAEAFRKLASDLEVLSKNKLILGHLAMPSTLELADTVGSGHTKKAVFCFLAIDSRKLDELTGKKQAKIDDLGFGLHEVAEGGTGPWIGYDPDERYQIEEVWVPKSYVSVAPAYDPEESYQDDSLKLTAIESDALRELIVQQYNDTKPLVNDISRKAKAYLADTEKVSRTHTTDVFHQDHDKVRRTKVHVDVDIIKKGSKE